MRGIAAPVANIILHGYASGNGEVKMATKPDYSRGRNGVVGVPVAAFPVKNASIHLPATVTAGSVQMYGSNGDPEDASTWFEIGAAVTATGASQRGAIADEEPWAWVKFEVTGYAGSGEIEVRLHAANRR